jgi:cytochrome c oxidase subunit 3
MHATVVGDTLLSGQFDDLHQQKNSSTLGMWAFLATEVMFFGGLFTAYSLYRWKFFDEFGEASRFLYLWVGFANTLVLLTSSLTMALAVHASATRQIDKVVRYLLATLALGVVFLGVKAWEWHEDYVERLIPGINFDWEYAKGKHAGEGHPGPAGPPPQAGIASNHETGEPQAPAGEGAPSSVEAGRAQMFFVLYFFLTGLHAFHMVIGIAAVGIMAWLSHRRWFSGGGETQIESLGLYWHFVDIVWVFLYPLLYLIQVRPH